jgi:hypothetical protein
MPVPRCNHVVAIDAQGRLFVIGGHTGPFALSTRVDVYNPEGRVRSLRYTVSPGAPKTS